MIPIDIFTANTGNKIFNRFFSLVMSLNEYHTQLEQLQQLLGLYLRQQEEMRNVLKVNSVAFPGPFGPNIKANDFIAQVKGYLIAFPQEYPNDQLKCRLFLSLIEKSKAQKWVRKLRKTNSPLLQNFDALTDTFGRLYSESVVRHIETRNGLAKLSQGNSSFLDICDRFKNLTSHLKMDDASRILILEGKLAPRLQNALLSEYPLPENFDDFANLCARLDERFPRKEEQSKAPSAGRLSEDERKRRILNRLCLYCAAPGHLKTACPIAPNAHVFRKLKVIYSESGEAKIVYA